MRSRKRKKDNCQHLNNFSEQEGITDSKPVYTREEERGRTLEAIAKMAERSYEIITQIRKLIEKAPGEVKQKRQNNNAES